MDQDTSVNKMQVRNSSEKEAGLVIQCNILHIVEKKRHSLTEAQVAKGLLHHTLVTDCPTRWGSQHKMISRILEQDVVIRMVLSDDRKNHTLDSNLARYHGS